jgi:hypothetical protein
MMRRRHPQQATLHSTVSTTMLSRLESLYHEKAKNIAQATLATDIFEPLSIVTLALQAPI